MSNFTFIKADFPALYADALEAERLTYTSPTATAIFCRSTFENAVNWLYDNDAKLTRPWRADLSMLMHEHDFQSLFNRTLFAELNLIRKTGNAAAHGNKISPQDALASLKYLFRFLRFLAIYYGQKTPDSQMFDDSLIPQPNTQKPQDQQQVQNLIAEVEQKNQAARETEQKQLALAEENQQLKQQLEQHRLEVAARKSEREQVVDIETAVPLLVSEAETRKRYIDVVKGMWLGYTACRT